MKYKSIHSIFMWNIDNCTDHVDLPYFRFDLLRFKLPSMWANSTVDVISIPSNRFKPELPIFRQLYRSCWLAPLPSSSSGSSFPLPPSPPPSCIDQWGRFLRCKPISARNKLCCIYDFSHSLPVFLSDNISFLKQRQKIKERLTKLEKKTTTTEETATFSVCVSVCVHWIYYQSVYGIIASFENCLVVFFVNRVAVHHFLWNLNNKQKEFYQ